MFLEMPLGGIELGFVETWETWGRFLNRIEGFRGLPEDSTAGLANFGDQFQLCSFIHCASGPVSGVLGQTRVSRELGHAPFCSTFARTLCSTPTNLSKMTLCAKIRCDLSGLHLMKPIGSVKCNCKDIVIQEQHMIE